MSKKKFTKGLESLFDNAVNASKEDTLALVEPSDTPKGPLKVKRVRAKGTSKDFTSDLDTLLEEALADDSVYNGTGSSQGPDPTKTKAGQAAPAAPRKALSGLDALIRKTIQVKVIDEKNENKATKRVTFAVDKRKLDKLKQIARVENAYLKDILSKIISDYIRQYDPAAPDSDKK